MFTWLVRQILSTWEPCGWVHSVGWVCVKICVAKLHQLAGVELWGQRHLGPSCNFISPCSVQIIEVLMEVIHFEWPDIMSCFIELSSVFPTKSSWAEHQSSLGTWWPFQDSFSTLLQGLSSAKVTSNMYLILGREENKWLLNSFWECYIFLYSLYEMHKPQSSGREKGTEEAEFGGTNRRISVLRSLQYHNNKLVHNNRLIIIIIIT